MKKWLGVGLAFGFVALASNSSLGGTSPLNVHTEQGNTAHIMPIHAGSPSNAQPGVIMNASYHGNKVLVTPKVVPIFWGSYWQDWCGSGPDERAAITAFLEQYGTSREFNTITQYYDIANGGTQYVQLHTLTHSYDVIDDPCNPHCLYVTDCDYQQEILKVVSNFDPQTVYEIFTGPAYTSVMSGFNSCDNYCAYHEYFVGSSYVAPKNAPAPKCGYVPSFAYAVLPYPMCGGCSPASFTSAEAIEVSMSHETREAVTHPFVDDNDYIHDGWFDPFYGELDDKCELNPQFIDGQFAYQPEWSNLNKACIKWR